MTNSGTGENSVEIFDVDSNSWSLGSPRPTAGTNGYSVGGILQATWRDSLIYCMGGSDFSVYNIYAAVDIYDPFTNTWSVGTPLPYPACTGAGVIIGDSIYLPGAWGQTDTFGGSWTSFYKGWINPVNPTNITWIQGPSLSTPVYSEAACALGHKVYWAGGMTSSGEVTDSTWVYDQATGAITTLVPHPCVGGIDKGGYLVARDMGASSALYTIAGDSGGNWSTPNRCYAMLPMPQPEVHVEERVGILPTASALDVLSPNPTRAQTAIRFALPNATHVELKVYSGDGRLVRTIVAGQVGAGYHCTEWDGRDAQGRNVEPGVYYVWLVTPEFQATRKLTLIE